MNKKHKGTTINNVWDFPATARVWARGASILGEVRNVEKKGYSAASMK